MTTADEIRALRQEVRDLRHTVIILVLGFCAVMGGLVLLIVCK